MTQRSGCEEQGSHRHKALGNGIDKASAHGNDAEKTKETKLTKHSEQPAEGLGKVTCTTIAGTNATLGKNAKRKSLSQTTTEI